MDTDGAPSLAKFRVSILDPGAESPWSTFRRVAEQKSDEGSSGVIGR